MFSLLGRVFGRLLGLLGLLLLVLGIVLRVRYGGGEAFPDRSGTARLPMSAVEVVANLPTPPGNIAVSADGRLFATLHPEGRPKSKVVEIVKGAAEPWPSEAFQTGAGEPRYFRSVLSRRIEAQGRLWTLDYGDYGTKPARLLAFDIAKREVVHEFVFPKELAGLGSMLNDFQVSPDGNFIYIADASLFAKNPALIVYDVKQGSARRLLAHHPSVTAEKFTPVVQGHKMVVLGVFAIRPGVDSIGLDQKGEWLYFAPVTNLNMSRIRTEDLRNESLDSATLAGKVEEFAPKTMSDGIALDNAGNVYMADPEHSAVVVLRADKTLETLVKDERLRWPDGFSFGPDGWLYLSCSSLHQIIGHPPWTFKNNAPYQIFRLKPGTPGVPGH